MKRLHIAISTTDISATINDYSQRLDCLPSVVIANEYALWRTESLNLSIRQDPSGKSGQLRHLGFEDPTAGSFTKTTDVNGIVWENFNAQQQADEINAIWPDAEYLANHPKGG